MSENKSIGKPFEPGHAKVGGRVKGARNKLSGDLLSALSLAFDEHGKAAIDIVAKEEPEKFLKICASLVPKELEITDNRLKDVPDEYVDAVIEHFERELGKGARSLEGGKDPAAH